MRRDHYSVYIIDWLLPDMNGIEVTRRIRKECGDEVPIIVLTAYDWADIEDEAKEAGVTAFCGKPLFLSELRDCLLSIVGTEETPEAAGETAALPLALGRILLAEDNELNQEIAQAILEEAGFTVEIAVKVNTFCRRISVLLIHPKHFFMSCNHIPAVRTRRTHIHIGKTSSAF